MGSFAGTCEIVEEKEDPSSVVYARRNILPNSGLSVVDKDLEHPVLKLGYKGSLEDDINQLFESISIKTSGMIPSHQVGSSTSTSRSTSPLGRNALKKPTTAGVPRSPGTGTSEPVTIKQALRDLCISKASELAATKRMSRTSGSPQVSETGRVRSVYASGLVESGSESELHLDESNVIMVGLSSSMEDWESNFSESTSQLSNILKIKSSSQSGQTSPQFGVQATQYGNGIMVIQNGIDSVQRRVRNQEPKMDILLKASAYTPSKSPPNNEDQGLRPGKVVPALTKPANETAAPKYVQKVRLLHNAPTSNAANSRRGGKLTRNIPRVPKPVLRNKVFVKKKIKQGSNPGVVTANVYDEVDGFFDPITKQLLCHRCHCVLKNANKEANQDCGTSPNVGYNAEAGSDNVDQGVKSADTEANQDASGLGSVNLDLENASQETSQDASGLGSVNLDSENTSEGTSQDISSSSNVKSGVINASKETSQDSLASFLVNDDAEVDFDSVNSGVKHSSKEVSRDYLSLPSSKEINVDSFSLHTSKEMNRDSLQLSTSEEIHKESLSLPNHVAGVGSGNLCSTSANNFNIDGAAEEEENESIATKGKGKFSQSSKDSIGEYSTSTSISEESNLSRSSFGNRPHMSKDVRWEAIQHVRMQHGVLGLRHFNLLKKLGCGDIGTVYLAELVGTNCLFAIKVMDNEFLARRKKIPRAQIERDILRTLDHPFLPTLYGHFTSDNLSCLVMEYCPGGDLHILRQKQPGRCFPEPAARFYVAEVLLALEYLHMLGVIYRDLKPENILVREDGHIMVTDFDLSLRCTVSPTLLRSSSRANGDALRISSRATESSCIEPLCIEPSVRVSCFTPKLLNKTKKGKKTRKLKKADLVARFRSLPQLVAEPTDARSNSFVGTHEYLAPEIIKGEGHGAAVDWWTFGVFLYELLYGRTPFKGSTNEETLANVVLQNLKFPDSPPVSFQAKDLIKGLLVKEPENRLGSVKGAAEIKRHPFFEGLNWALIRCAIPPELPDLSEYGVSNSVSHDNKGNYLECKAIGEHLEFELF